MTATTATTTTKIVDLFAYCNNCMARQNENYQLHKKDYATRRAEDQKIKDEMKNDVAAYFGFADLSEAVKTKVFEKAWEEGHSGGYMDVAMAYEDLLELADFIKKN